MWIVAIFTDGLTAQVFSSALGLASIHYSVCTHQIIQGISRNGYGHDGHDDKIININVILLHCGSKNHTPVTFSNNFNKYLLILIIFGTANLQRVLSLQVCN